MMKKIERGANDKCFLQKTMKKLINIIKYIINISLFIKYLLISKKLILSSEKNSSTITT